MILHDLYKVRLLGNNLSTSLKDGATGILSVAFNRTSAAFTSRSGAHYTLFKLKSPSPRCMVRKRFGLIHVSMRSYEDTHEAFFVMLPRNSEDIALGLRWLADNDPCPWSQEDSTGFWLGTEMWDW